MAQLKITRKNPNGMDYIITEWPIKQTAITNGGIVMVVPHEIEVILAAWWKWVMRGDLIQDAFHMFDAGQREFLMTGITPTRWKELFDDLYDVVAEPNNTFNTPPKTGD